MDHAQEPRPTLAELLVDLGLLSRERLAVQPAPESNNSDQPLDEHSLATGRHRQGVRLEEPEEGQGPRTSHLVFVLDGTAYRLLERHAPPPRLGARLSLPEVAGEFVALKLARSPLPADSRVCAYLGAA